ncbi:MAG: hypothetical protein ACLUGU_04850 [Alistipes shahii]
MSAPDRSSPHRWIFLPRNGCNIAPGTDPAPEAATEDFRNFGQRFSGADFCCRQTTASCTFVCRKVFRHIKVLALRGWAFSRVATLFKPYMDTNRKQTNRNARKPETASYKYSFRLNEEQNIRFKELLCKAGSEHNRSRFIVKRIFAEEFVVVRRDPSKTQFVARLNDFYFQFQKLANNYNQIVKVINAHFSNIAIPHQIAALEQRTRELKAFSIEILNLVKKAAQ